MTFLAINKKAGFDYQILQTFEAGIELKGFEVKSIKSGRINLVGSYVIIRDNQAWLLNSDIPPYQPKNTPADYDAMTTITVDVEEFDQMKDKLTVWPNPVKDNLKVTFNNAPCGMYVVELISTNGLAVHSRLYSEIMLQNGLNIDVAGCAPGQYVLRIVFGNRTETRKIVVQ